MRSPAIAHAVTGSLAVTALDAALLALALGGVSALLAHTRALALLAIGFAAGVVLALLRPVRTHDPQATAAEPKLAFAALFLVPLLVPPVAALGERLRVFPWFARPAIEWTGVALVALGLGIRIAAMATLGSRFSPIVAVQRDHALETRGIYGRVRHPGYLGSALACAGGMLAFGSALALPLVLAFTTLIRHRIRREERALLEHFGDDYRRYRERTGALLPARRRGP